MKTEKVAWGTGSGTAYNVKIFSAVADNNEDDDVKYADDDDDVQSVDKF